jgi:hypothetical protein
MGRLCVRCRRVHRRHLAPRRDTVRPVREQFVHATVLAAPPISPVASAARTKRDPPGTDRVVTSASHPVHDSTCSDATDRTTRTETTVPAPSTCAAAHRGAASSMDRVARSSARPIPASRFTSSPRLRPPRITSRPALRTTFRRLRCPTGSRGQRCSRRQAGPRSPVVTGLPKLVLRSILANASKPR